MTGFPINQRFPNTGGAREVRYFGNQSGIVIIVMCDRQIAHDTPMIKHDAVIIRFEKDHFLIDIKLKTQFRCL